VFFIYLGTNSDLCHLQHKLIGLYNLDEKCLQRGTDWASGVHRNFFGEEGLCQKHFSGLRGGKKIQLRTEGRETNQIKKSRMTQGSRVIE
jgi:hypothetical protein